MRFYLMFLHSLTVSYFAKWTLKVGIDFFLRGGTFSTPIQNPIVLNSGKTPTIPSVSPTKEHHVFKGWYDSMNAIVELTATPLTTKKKLYAKWERKKYNISYEEKGGIFSIIEQAKVQTEVKYNLKPILPTPTKSGEYFIGWFKDIAKTMPYNWEKVIGDLT